MRITNNFVLFFSKNDMMSNFYSKQFKHQKHMFSNSEQAFMWRKAMFFKDYEIAHQILTKAKQPNYAKSLGRKVKNFDNEQWDKVRYNIMKEVVKDKINQFNELKTFIENNKGSRGLMGQNSALLGLIGLQHCYSRVPSRCSCAANNRGCTYANTLGLFQQTFSVAF